MVVATVALGGCGGGGGGSDEEQIRDVVAELQDASREADGSRICDELFTENLRISVERASGQSCPDEVAQNIASDSASFELENIEVEGDNATAQVVDEEGRRSDVVFQREGEEWRIARIAGAGA